jgi:hypothetical protein
MHEMDEVLRRMLKAPPSPHDQKKVRAEKKPPNNKKKPA